MKSDTVDSDISGYVDNGDATATTGGGEAWVELWRHGAYVFGELRRHGRWWLTKSMPGGEERLRKEFDIALSLDHPNVVRVIDFRDIPAIGPSIVMEWVDGQTLGECLAQGTKAKLPHGLWDDIISAVCYMHGRGVVHGDLKPANVMVTHEGRAKIIDYGLGTATWSALPNGHGGTTGYSAPEQMAGGAADKRSDVYALGRLLGDLGRRGIPHIPLTMGRVVAKATSEEPERRYADAPALKRAVRRVSHWLYGIWIVVSAGILTAVMLSALSGSKTGDTHVYHIVRQLAPTLPPDTVVRHDTVLAPMPATESAPSIPNAQVPDDRPTIEDVTREYNRRVDSMLRRQNWTTQNFTDLLQDFIIDLRGANAKGENVEKYISDPYVCRLGLVYAHSDWAYIDSAIMRPEGRSYNKSKLGDRMRESIRKEYAKANGACK